MKKSEAEALKRVRWEQMGRWLSLAFRYYDEAVVRRMNEHGFTDIRVVHTSLIRCMDAEGTRLTDIADRAGMHKQAIGQLVKECEQTGYVERRPDPVDGRAQLICFTKRGLKLLKALAEIHADSENDFVEIIGADRIGPFKRALHRVAEIQRRAEAARHDVPKMAPPNGARRKRGRPPKSRASKSMRKS